MSDDQHDDEHDGAYDDDHDDGRAVLHIASTVDGLVLTGEIDAHTAPRLARLLTPLPGTSGDVTVDLGGVDFVDSSGLGVLIDAHRRAAGEGRRFVLARPSPAVVRLLEISGLVDHLTISTAEN